MYTANGSGDLIDRTAARRGRSREQGCLRSRSDCYRATGGSEPVCGRELPPLKSSAFRGALLRQLWAVAR